MNDILVIGSSNMDLIMKMEHLPKTGESIADCTFSQAFGGKGANQAVGAARAGGKVTFISCIGTDAYGKMMLENFGRDNINTEFVFQTEDHPTGTALIMVGSKGENYISVAPGANYQLSPAMIDRCKAEIKKASIVVLQYEITEETTDHIISLCNSMNIPVIFNLAPAKKISEKSLKNLKFLVVNETEAQFLTGMEEVNLSNAEEASASLLALGPENVIITLGENGSYIASFREYFHSPSFKVKAVDSTAAGDTYCGALATALSMGKSLKEAVPFASAAAALAVTRLGAQQSTPYKEEIEEFLKKNN